MSKKNKQYEENLSDLEDEEFIREDIEQDNTDTCPNCDNRLEKDSLGVRWLLTCRCGYRRIVKK